MLMLMEPSPTPPPFPIPQGEHSNYDFIFNPPGKRKKSIIPSGNSPKQRLLIAIAGGGILLIVIILGVSMLFGGKNNADALLDIAQRQAEIIRVSELGFLKAKGSEARNLAITTKLTLQTSETQTLDRLKKLHKKANDKTLALKKNAQTDQNLTDASLNNKFDTTFIEIMRSSLSDYQKAVKELYDTTGSKTEKQILAASYDGVTLLIK